MRIVCSTSRHPLVQYFYLVSVFWVHIAGCGSGINSSGSSNISGSASCTTLKGTAWVPSVASISASNHDSSVSVTQTVVNTTGPIVGLGQAVPSSKEITVTIDMTRDLGQYGSLSLIAQTTQFPSSLQGGAFAYLVSLNDGVNELINLARTGTNGDCAAAGYYSCTGSSCSANTSCTISSPSAYFDRSYWEQHQGSSSSATNEPSVNIFPTCNWSGGSDGSTSQPACDFNTTFFPSSSPARLRYGTTYTAKYVLLSDSYTTLTNQTAGLKVTTIKKTSTRTSKGGAFDLNFILVGNSNINSSRTTKGQQNLNTLAETVYNYYNQSNVGIGIGSVNAVEWPCSSGGDTYSNPDVSVLGDLFTAGSNIIPSSYAGKAINVFLVSSISDSSSSNSNFTILGVDGAIGGPVINGTAESGMVVSTFDELASLNSNCPSSAATCSLSEQDQSSFELASTISHEMGHFLGLNHPSEYAGTLHDAVIDTPVCTATSSVGGGSYITLNACRTKDTNVFPVTGMTCSQDCGNAYYVNTGTYCPNATSCEFNYIMFWTTKNFWPDTGSSDGNLFSSGQARIMNYHPIVQ